MRCSGSLKLAPLALGRARLGPLHPRDSELPRAKMFMPALGRPGGVYERYEEDNNLTRGPEGIHTRRSDGPGFGWDLKPAG